MWLSCLLLRCSSSFVSFPFVCLFRFHYGCYIIINSPPPVPTVHHLSHSVLWFQLRADHNLQFESLPAPPWASVDRVVRRVHVATVGAPVVRSQSEAFQIWSETSVARQKLREVLMYLSVLPTKPRVQNGDEPLRPGRPAMQVVPSHSPSAGDIFPHSVFTCVLLQIDLLSLRHPQVDGNRARHHLGRLEGNGPVRGTYP